MYDHINKIIMLYVYDLLRFGVVGVIISFIAAEGRKKARLTLDPGVTFYTNPTFSTRRQNALFFGVNRPRGRFNKGRGVPKYL